MKNKKNVIPFKKASEKEASIFVQTAVAFDTDVSELERLARQIEEATLDKESGYARAQKLMVYFGEAGTRVAEQIQVLARELEAARLRAESAGRIVASRAEQVREKNDQTKILSDRFVLLGSGARELAEKVAAIRSTSSGEDSKHILLDYVPELSSRISSLLDEAQVLKTDARQEKFSSLEENVDVLIQNLAAAQKKLNSLLN